MKVAVVGGGPAGLFAAWASIQWGCSVKVFDKNPEKIGVGQNHGVFALFDECDLFLSQKQEIQVGVIGGHNLKVSELAAAYSRKVYGEEIENSSIASYMGNPRRLVYNHAEAYDQILEFLGRENIVGGFEIKGMGAYDRLLDDDYDLIISTIPAPVLFPTDTWPSSKAWIFHSDAPKEEGFMIYNVNEFIPWYRCSAILGHFTMEYAQEPSNGKNHIQVTKVLDPPVSPKNLMGPYYRDQIWFTGRYGAWQKDMLTENVYYNVLKQFSDRQHGSIRSDIRIAEPAAI